MRKWEDIVRDKLGGTEDHLPESVFAEFQACLDRVDATPKGKRFPPGWVIAATAVAAGLAAVFFIGKPKAQEEVIQETLQPMATYSQPDDSMDAAPPHVLAPLIAQATHIKTVRPMQDASRPTEATMAPEYQEPLIPESEDIGPQDTAEEPATVSRPVVSDSSPIVHQSTDDPDIHIKRDSWGTIAAGGGLLAALLTQLASVDVSGPVPGGHAPTATNDGSGKSHPHRMPLVVGLSVKCPITEKLGITTGLEYSLYSSSFQYPTGDKTQLVHYLGIPVRLDWTFASGRWIDAYLGAGVKGDLCLGATLTGEAIGKDGPAFRLLGAGGMQFNATQNLGLFVEPEVSWTLPSERRILSTYSSEHPWMFSVAAGLRFNLGN